jgi:hypothetical protein
MGKEFTAEQREFANKYFSDNSAACSGIPDRSEPPDGYKQTPAKPDEAAAIPDGYKQTPARPDEAAAIPDGYKQTPAKPDEAAAGGVPKPAQPQPPTKGRKWDIVQGAARDELKGKRVCDEYEGEHNRAGWRAKDWNTSVDQNDPRITTRLYTDEEIKANLLVQGEDGTFKKGDGSDVENKLEYTMDPATGEMVTFKQKVEVVMPRSGRPDERVDANPSDALRMVSRASSLRIEATHHSTVLGADKPSDGVDTQDRQIRRSRAAASAGHVEFDLWGKLTKISNRSGHYRPTFEYLLQAVEHLARSGAFFDEDEIVDADGKDLDGNSPALKLYEAAQRERQKVASLTKRAVEIGEAATGNESLDDESLKKELITLQTKIETSVKNLDTAQDLLSRLGVGPSRRLRGDVELVKGVDKQVNGRAVHDADSATFSVDKFLRTGGGNTAESIKKRETLQELTNKTGEAHKKLIEDTETEDRAKNAVLNKKRPIPTEDQIARALSALGGDQKLADGSNSKSEVAEDQWEDQVSGYGGVPTEPEKKTPNKEKRKDEAVATPYREVSPSSKDEIPY